MCVPGLSRSRLSAIKSGRPEREWNKCDRPAGRSISPRESRTQAGDSPEWPGKLGHSGDCTFSLGGSVLKFLVCSISQSGINILRDTRLSLQIQVVPILNLAHICKDANQPSFPICPVSISLDGSLPAGMRRFIRPDFFISPTDQAYSISFRRRRRRRRRRGSSNIKDKGCQTRGANNH